jgi:Flp pilus assembly protein TadG
MFSVLGRFERSVSGNMGIMAAVLAVPLVLAAGFGIDTVRHSSAQKHLQEMVDATALALAASKELDEDKLRVLASHHLNANQRDGRLQNFQIVSLASTKDDIDLVVSGEIPATLMAIAGYEQLSVGASALAQRAVTGQVEVALILDNTYSMSIKDNGSTARLAILKTAASALVNELLAEPDSPVKIALVPYADYVNVGTHNRNASWLQVEADYSTTTTSTPKERTCTTQTTDKSCVRYEPKTTCYNNVDGVQVPYSCGGGCAEYGPEYPITPKEVCSGGGEPKTTTTHFKWHGCVNSRTGTGNRLHNNNLSVKYVGRITRENQFFCMAPIVELTNNRQTLLNAISGMVFERNGYQPRTYIPAGLVWGFATLDPSEPFTSAAAYDIDKQKPRKVAVLMTDGENTMRWNSNGTHSNTTDLAALTTTNNDTKTICTNMKTAGIEIFTIAFMVEDGAAKTMLQGCASNPDTHYFDAADSADLLAAFSGISDSLRVVRLAR